MPRTKSDPKPKAQHGGARPNSGGARPNAGRPTKADKAKTVGVTLPADVLARLQARAEAEAISAPKLAAQLIAAALPAPE